MKTKLLLGALTAAIITGGAITVSAMQSPTEPTSNSQTSQVEPVVSAQAAPTPEASAEVVTPHRGSDVFVETPAAPSTPTKPTCSTRENVYCYGVHGVDEYGTPIPEVQVTQPAQPWVRDDGYFNYCYLLENGNWTTVTGKLELGKGIYYYGGAIDPDSQAPAYAVESQQWCAANVPAEAR